MEQFISNFIRNCREFGVTPTDTVINQIIDRKTPEDASKNGKILNLSGSNLPVKDCAVLAKTLSEDRYIEELRFADCLLTEESCKLLLNYISSNRALKRVDFKGNNIRSAAELVGRILKKTTTLTHLSLEWNAIGLWEFGLASIAEGLQVNQTLRYLDLRNNQITYGGGAYIANALKSNRVLKTLDLRWNNIGLQGARAFLSMLKHNTEIMRLELAGSIISPKRL